MSEMSPHKGSAVWAMLLTVVVAWAACGVYRWRVPPSVDVRTVVQVPAATDLESLCQHPDVLQASAHKLGDASVETSPAEQSDSGLSGKLLVRKLSSADRPASSDTPTVPGETEAWELTYRTTESNGALETLSALVAVLQQRIESAAVELDAGSGSQSHSPARIQELDDECLKVELELEALTDQAPPTQDVDDLADTEHSLTPEQSLSSLRFERQRLDQEWSLVQQELQADTELGALASKLTPGPMQEIILQLDRQHQLSRELTRLNETEQRFSGIYGDRHPKLIDVRRQFDRVLTELGGWDEVLNEQHLIDQLQAEVESLIASKQQQQDDLQLQMELERENSTANGEATRQRSLLTRQLENLRQEMAAAQAAEPARTAEQAARFVTVQPPQEVSTPWVFNFGLLFGLTTVCGLIAGKLIHRGWTASVDEDDSDLDLPPLPSFVPAPEAQLDLAQRRAVRQARLQQAYAG